MKGLQSHERNDLETFVFSDLSGVDPQRSVSSEQN